GIQILANLFYKHLLVSAVNTLFFCWAMGILWLKVKKLRHQKEALLLDVLPREVALGINAGNVHLFIENVYSLPPRLRDSLMVNRIRKALELYETRPNVAEVSSQMSSQSDIDSARIGGSFAMLKAFLWAIPILGFIGTVLGLSHAIGGMNFANVDDVKVIIGSINNVTSGLGTAFDATLLGLVLAMMLNFPLNAMMKAEDDNLNEIDAFCNDVMLPRLSDEGAGSGDKFGGGENGALVEALVTALGTAQQELLVDLKAVTEKVREQAANLDKRADAHAVLVATEFSQTMLKMREEMNGSINASVAKTTEYVRSLATALQGLNGVLKDLGEKQVIIHQSKKRGWFGN
ncbi:MAG: MotA/TolQ/ExbB proton channel family protein, partial [Verrucomicrobiaceae bacterium]|nr:MotA/TolQ/ExbB proton channel family protein [Verrucomicrobiaceae bacterium]